MNYETFKEIAIRFQRVNPRVKFNVLSQGGAIGAIDWRNDRLNVMCRLEPYQTPTVEGVAYMEDILQLPLPSSCERDALEFIERANRILVHGLRAFIVQATDARWPSLRLANIACLESNFISDDALIRLFEENRNAGRACIYTMQQIDHGIWRSNVNSALEFFEEAITAIKDGDRSNP